MQQKNVTWNDVDELWALLWDSVLPWVTSTTYEQGDVRTNHWGSPADYGMFACIEGHISGASSEPGVGGSYTTYWKQVAGGGGVGPTGAAGATGGNGPTQIMQFRLTPTSGVPVIISDVASAPTLYITPYGGNYAGLYYNSAWAAYTSSELSLSLAGLPANTTYDVFMYYTGAAVAVEKLVWKQVAASNSPTLGLNKTINLGDTTGVLIGDWVTVYDASHNEKARVNTVNTNTSIVVDELVYGYTTPTINYNNYRGTQLTTQDGVKVKTGDATKRYIGCFRTASAANTCMTATQPFIENEYNKEVWILNLPCTSDYVVPDSASLQARNNDPTTQRIEILSGSTTNKIKLINKTLPGGNPVYSTIGISKDKISSFAHESKSIIGQQINAAGGVWLSVTIESSLEDFCGLGYHFYIPVESSTETGVYHYNNNKMGGMYGEILR